MYVLTIYTRLFYDLWFSSFYMYIVDHCAFILFSAVQFVCMFSINITVILFYSVISTLQTIMPLLSFYVNFFYCWIIYQYASVPCLCIKYLIQLVMACSSSYNFSAINNIRPVLKYEKKIKAFWMLTVSCRLASKSKIILSFCVYSNSLEWMDTILCAFVFLFYTCVKKSVRRLYPINFIAESCACLMRRFGIIITL